MSKVSELHRSTKNVKLACLCIQLFFAWFTEICTTPKIMWQWRMDFSWFSPSIRNIRWNNNNMRLV